MAITNIDISRRRGDTKRMVFVIKDDNGIVDITTGYSFIMTIDPEKEPVNDTNNLFQIVGNLLEPSAGRVSFSPTDADADNLGSYYHDIQMIDPNTEKSTIVYGKYKLSQDITKD